MLLRQLGSRKKSFAFSSIHFARFQLTVKTIVFTTSSGVANRTILCELRLESTVNAECQIYLTMARITPASTRMVKRTRTRATVSHLLLVLLLASFGCLDRTVQAFAGGGFSGKNNGDATSSLTLFDRFRAQCPADPDSIRQFAPSLIPPSSANDDEESSTRKKDDDDDVWVAVYRSNNNQPSVLVQDEFLHAMRSATTTSDASTNNMVDPASISLRNKNAPVAVARLQQKSDTTANYYLIDSLRCILKKETTDASCDGGSEHTEAVAVAIDALVIYYLRQQQQQQNSNSRFEGVLRAKGTLVAGTLLQDRGFRPVETMQTDLTTHHSSLDDCLERYAARSVLHTTGPQARERAVEIVSRLGRIDRAADLAAAQRESKAQEQDSDDVDPWAAMKRLI